MRAQRIVPALVVIVLIAAGLCCYGLGAGGTFYHRLVRAPFAPAIDAPYYRASVLHVALGHVLGLGGSILAFRFTVLACFWAALAYLAVALRGRLVRTDLCLVLCVLMFQPAAMIVHAWTCHPDAITCLLTAVLLCSRRPWVLVVVAAIVTVGVYGLVGGIVKLDDLGLKLVKGGPTSAALGRGILAFAPKFMKFLSIAGTAAMFLVGGGILVHGIPALHHIAEAAGAMTPGWLWENLFNALVGILAGALVLAVVRAVGKLRGSKVAAAH